MARKKTAEEATATKTVVRKTAEKKVVKKDEVLVDAENAGFRACDGYNALHDNEGANSVKELVKLTGKTEVEVLLGIGWLLKEGKLKGEDGKVVLA